MALEGEDAMLFGAVTTAEGVVDGEMADNVSPDELDEGLVKGIEGVVG